VRSLNLDILVTRGPAVESRHRVHAAVVDESGCLIASANSTDLVAHWRSCAKPLQVHPLVESGKFDELGWGEPELALACASHGGEPEHVALASSMLHSIGLDESALACGPHIPLSGRGAQLLHESGATPTKLHNNCSGKHSAMMALATRNGWPNADYHDPSHPVQRTIRHGLSRWTGLENGALDIGTDGCGVPVFILSLLQMATAYARFAHAAHSEAAPARILSAMGSQPFLVGGTDRFDTVLTDATDGGVVAKVGAEGVHTVLIRDRSIGFAIKVEDGAARAQYPAVLRLLQHLDALPADLPAPLHDFLVTPVRDTRGEVVGEIRPAA
jgi:L-asparaginase II